MNDADWFFENAPEWVGSRDIKVGDVVSHVTERVRAEDPAKVDLHLVLDIQPTVPYRGLAGVEIRLLRIRTNTEEKCSSTAVPAFFRHSRPKE